MSIIEQKLYFTPYYKNSLLSPGKFSTNYFTIKKISLNNSENKLLSKYKLNPNKQLKSRLSYLTNLCKNKGKDIKNLKLIKPYDKPSMIKIIERNKEEENKIFLKPFYDKSIKNIKNIKNNETSNKFVKLMVRKTIIKNNTMKNLFQYNINFKGDCFRSNSSDNYNKLTSNKKSISPINFMEIINLNLRQNMS